MKKLLLPLAMSASLFTGVAMAGTSTGTINTTLTVEEACEMQANPANFGAVSLATGAQTQATVTIRCTPGAAYSVTIVQVDNPTSDDFVLKNTSGDEISFSAYSDSARTTLWNSTTPVTGTSTGASAGDVKTVYLSIPAQPMQAAGHYEAQFQYVNVY